MNLRDERPEDADAIHAVTDAAFEGHPHSGGTEAFIVAALRRANALTFSLVTDENGKVVGHIAFSPVRITTDDGAAVEGWYGLGPVSVAPSHQRRGIGSALIREGLRRLRGQDATGCVLLGDPAYYARFGFVADAGLRYPGPPPEYFQSLAFEGTVPLGTVAYHAAFDATE